ncbi:MAG TPA: DUF2933 domain-containing protein [Dongiaceae bacterium]|jgi:hypothetical protein|nr:DUF2933 domain-containing protein [Dongiaceae bacterium]
MSHSHTDDDHPRASGFWKSKAGLVTAGFLIVGLFFLVSEHRAHLLGILPYLLILACPLMHLFMHRGHGSHHHGTQTRKPDSGADS